MWTSPHPRAKDSEKIWLFGPYPKAVPGKLEISDVFKCFFAYSSGVMFSRAESGFFSLSLGPVSKAKTYNNESTGIALTGSKSHNQR
jgi:hypothetical protein